VTSMREQPTEVLEGATAPVVPRAEPRRRRRIAFWVLLPLVIVGLLVAVDSVARAVAEERVSAEIEANLPDTVKGDVDVRIGGFSVIVQYLAGEFESVELDAPRAVVNGAPLSATIRATGVPVDFSKPIRSATGTLSISETSLNALVAIPGSTGDVALGDGTIGYSGRVDLLGLPIDYAVSAKATAAGQNVLLQPDSASVTTGAGDVNLEQLVRSLSDTGPFPVCAAQYLPDGVTVSDIRVKPGRATVTLAASKFVLDETFLHSKGSCS
jgi:hypothetical protein